MKSSSAGINRKVAKFTKMHGAVKVLSSVELAAFAKSRNMEVAK